MASTGKAEKRREVAMEYREIPSFLKKSIVDFFSPPQDDTSFDVLLEVTNRLFWWSFFLGTAVLIIFFSRQIWGTDIPAPEWFRELYIAVVAAFAGVNRLCRRRDNNGTYRGRRGHYFFHVWMCAAVASFVLEIFSCGNLFSNGEISKEHCFQSPDGEIAYTALWILIVYIISRVIKPFTDYERIKREEGEG